MAADPYRLTDEKTTETPQAKGDRTQILLWVVLVVSAGINAVLSTINVYAGTAAGVVVLGTAVALVVNHRKSKAKR